jgi:hypothetical protein
MSLNHIIQSSVPDDEALDVKFNNVEVLGTITGGNFPTTVFKMLDQRIITGIDGEQSLFVDNLSIGSRTIPANTLKAGSIIDIEIRGTAFNQFSTNTVSLDLRFNISGNIIVPMVPVSWDSALDNRAFICKAKLLVRSSVLISGYFDWDIPNIDPNLSISSRTRNLLNPLDFSVDNDINVLCSIINGNATETIITSNFGTITIQ